MFNNENKLVLKKNKKIHYLFKYNLTFYNYKNFKYIFIKISQNLRLFINC